MFAEWLHDVGQGKDLPLMHTFVVSPHMVSGPQIADLIQQIYPGFGNAVPTQDAYFLKRAILCPRNTEADEINAYILVMHRSFTSKEAGAYQYPVGFSEFHRDGGLPPAHLEVKAGVPLMLLCNLDQSQGLCNGTRLQLVRMQNRVLEVRIITGPCAGKIAFIPRITISPSDGDLPFELHRRQFPVCLAFAMTINKAQGQLLGTVGLDLIPSVWPWSVLCWCIKRGQLE